METTRWRNSYRRMRACLWLRLTKLSQTSICSYIAWECNSFYRNNSMFPIGWWLILHYYYRGCCGQPNVLCNWLYHMFIRLAFIHMYRSINPIRMKRMDSSYRTDSSEREYAFASRPSTNWIKMNRLDDSACLTNHMWRWLLMLSVFNTSLCSWSNAAWLEVIIELSQCELMTDYPSTSLTFVRFIIVILVRRVFLVLHLMVQKLCKNWIQRHK